MMQEYVNPHYNIVIIVSSILKVIMVSIINRTEEDQTKIIDKDAKNKFKWSWLEKFVTVEIEKKSHKVTLANCIESAHVLKQKNKARIVIK